jgi:hypothetical protein
VRDLIQRMSRDNPLWGASRIHGELSTVSKYMVRGRRPPSQSWKTFLRNHANAIAAIDLCVVQNLSAYAAFCSRTRTYLALQRDAPMQRAIQKTGTINAVPILGGLHHEYVRI